MIQQWLAQWGSNPIAGSQNAQGQYVGGPQNQGGTNSVIGFPQFQNPAQALPFVQQAYSPTMDPLNALQAPGGFAAAGDPRGRLSPFSVANVDAQLAQNANPITTDAGNVRGGGLVGVPSSSGGGEGGNASGSSFSYPQLSPQAAQQTIANDIYRAEIGGYPAPPSNHILMDALIHGLGPALSGLATAGLGSFLGTGATLANLGISPEMQGIASFLGSAGSQALAGGTSGGVNSLNNTSGLLNNFAQTGANPISAGAMMDAPGIAQILNGSQISGAVSPLQG